MKRPLRFILIPCVLAVAALSVARPSFAQGPEPGLFSTLPEASRPALPDMGVFDPGVRRVNYVGLRFDQLDQNAASRATEQINLTQTRPTLLLNLFDDVTLTAAIDRVERTPDRQSIIWHGEIVGEWLSSFTLAVTGDVASGNIRTIDGRFYQLRYVSPGVFAVRDVDSDRLPEGGEPKIAPPGSLAAGPKGASANASPEPAGDVVAADDGSIIDVMVVFSPAARTAAGGLAAINNLIVLGMSETNQGYANSGVIQRVRLVHTAEVAYTEDTSGPGAFDNALAAVTNGNIANVHTLRNTHGADLVSLWIEDIQYCGLAWLMTFESPGFESLGYSVVGRTCGTGTHSFAHEMGHNQGSHHDRFVTGGGQGVKPYSFGFVQKSSAPNFRTVMAYSNDCGGCTRINYWSNPGVLFNGFVTGIADPAANSAHNQRSLNETRNTVANWRTAVTPLPNISINNVAVTEGNAGTTNANFNVTLSAAALGEVSVQYATANGTATGSTTTAAFSNNGAITIPGSGAAPASSTPYPSTINVAGTGIVSKVTVTLNGFSHNFTRDVDILLVGPGGQKIVLLSDIGGAGATPAANLTFDDGAAANLGSSPPASGTYRPTNINDSEGTDSYAGPAPAGPYGSALSDFAGQSANGAWSLYVVDDFSGDGGSIANGWTLNITSTTAGSDFAPVSGTLVFAPGDTSKQISVPVMGDVAGEANETFFLNLSNPNFLATISDNQGVGTINNDDAVNLLSINDVAVVEGNAGTTNAVFTLTLSPASASTVTVSAITSNGTATAGSDYTATGPTTITFLPGDTSETFTVPVLGDTAIESTETFNVTLSNPVNGVIGDGTGVGTITTDDFPSRTFVAASGSDAADCGNQLTPCRNIAAALLQTAIDGEIIILSPGEYETATLAITKGIKITSPSGTVAFIRQPITVNAGGGRVVLRGLTLKGTGAGNAITLTAADSISIEDSTIDRWAAGLRLNNGAASRVSMLNTIVRNNTAGILDTGASTSNRVAVTESRFERNAKGLEILTGTFQVKDSTFSGNTTSGIVVGPGIVDVQHTEFSLNAVGLSTLAGGTARIGRSHVFGNTTGLSAAGGSTLSSFGTNVVRRNTTNTSGTISAVAEQ